MATHGFGRLRHAAALALLALATAAGAATTTSLDYSDLWYDPAESGWGAGLYQQGDAIFMTLYVYGADGRGTWYVAPDLRAVAYVAPGPPMFQGALYRTSGPAFAGAFDPASVSASATGSASLTFPAAGSGTLAYTVEGVSVTKSIRRQTWRAPSIAGHYAGGMSATASSCGDGASNGPTDFLGHFDVVESGTTVSITVASPTLVKGCVYTGTWQQAGRLGAIANGSFFCADDVVVVDEEGAREIALPKVVDNVGSFSMERIETGPQGFYGHFSASDQYCRYSGRFGGTRRGR